MAARVQAAWESYEATVWISMDHQRLEPAPGSSGLSFAALGEALEDAARRHTGLAAHAREVADLATVLLSFSTTLLLLGMIHRIERIRRIGLMAATEQRLMRKGVERGSSPRARGKQKGTGRVVDRCRFIPACAGKTRLPRVQWLLPTVHPRVRGENGAGACG